MQAAITQLEGRDRGFFIAVMAVIDQLFEDIVGEKRQDRVGAFLDFVPDHQTLIGVQRFKNVGDFLRRHPPELLAKFLAILLLDLRVEFP
jgi:hypothetical protein